VNLTNFYDHPGDNRFLVFKFFDEKVAEEFKSLLDEQAINYETDQSYNEANNLALFVAVNKSDREKATKANYLAFGKYRKPMIPNKILRYGFLIVVFLMIALAIVGALISSK